MNLNLGCGKDIRDDCVNVDSHKYYAEVQVVDLGMLPWPWKDNSIDIIYASHIMEHFQDQEKFLNECWRILKKDGILVLNLPHSSSVSSIGCMGHYHTYSYSAVHDYLSREGFYLCKHRRFETYHQRLNWWYEKLDNQNELERWMKPIIIVMNFVFSFLANLSPKLCENLWCYWVGGFREVVWKGYKCYL